MVRIIRICRKCGAKIFSDAPEGLCTGCVLKTALAFVAAHDSSAVASAEADDATCASHVEIPKRAVGLLGELGDYELLEEVGRGGQGVVFRARQKSLNRIVALKVISLGPWASKAHLKRFRLEAEAAARLEHPGIVPIHEVGERDGSCYFSMKFVEGGQIDEVARREPMPIRRAVELITKVARTVHYAHEHGILHRDIKPGNILLDAKGEPHLTDFGLARLVETESTMTRTLDVLGTPSYMAPEQAMGNNAAVSSVTDIYGVITRDRAAATAAVKSENRSRPQHHLPQVSGERSKAPLRFRAGAGRRSRTLAQARTDSGATHRSFRARREMGPAQSNNYPPRGSSGWSGGGRWLDRLEK